jgi:TonB family protein
VGHGIGEGYGIKIGPGSGDGTDDSWYARQVQQRISSNWLRSLIGDVRGNYEVIISFYVRDNGAIVGISIEKPSGVRSLDDSALRAIKISDPLAPLPFELRGKAVKFVAQFPYPPK